MKERKLCLVIPSLQAGGMERVMSELLWHFSTKASIELHLVLYGITREIYYLIPENIIIHRPLFKFNNKWRLLYAIKTLIYLRKTIRQINPERILSFGELWNSFVLLALSGLNYPVYISDRCSPNKQFGIFQTILRRLLYSRAKGIISQTEMAKQIYQKEFRNNNIIVIGNPIREIKDSKGTERENIVLSVGRLIETKHHDKLIELFLRIGMPEWKLVIVGYDHLQEKNFDRLKSIIRNNNAENNIFLEGKRFDVESYYSKSRIFAFTSSSEGFPNVIGEAMSAYLPVIAFDCVAGPSEMVKDNYNGFLIPLFNYNLFQEKLQMLMLNEHLRESFGNNAKNYIKQYSTTRICEQYLTFLLK